ncbi:Uncharacterised protein [uncultured archaeon]|nr:Uncharacterised protein [uncultured archaeon]
MKQNKKKMAKIKNETEKRNLLQVISNCLDEHRVTISEGNGSQVMRLIEVNVPSILYKDFIDTYNSEVQNFQKKLAKKLMGEDSSQQTYGVLIDSDLKYSFAFNRKFADLDRRKKRINFAGVEDLLLGLANTTDLTKPSKDSEPVMVPVAPGPVIRPGNGFRRRRGRGGGGMLIRYALQGREDESSSGPVFEEIRFEKSSLIPTIKDYYDKTKKIILDGEKGTFYLDGTSYMTSTAEDFIRTYQGELSGFQERLARKVFGDEKSRNEYGIIFNSDLQMIFAFNRAFARYDPKSKKVVFNDAEDVLLKLSEGKDLSSLVTPPKKTPQPGLVAKYGILGSDSGGMTLEYGIIDGIEFDENFDDFGGSSMEMRYALQGKK